jgi:ketosteroid isomerase-like protein
MTEAVEIATRYFTAWTSKDIDATLDLLSDDIVCDAPAGRLDGKEAFRAFIEPFAGSLRSANLWAAFGEGDRAVIVYDTETPAAASGPGAELLTVSDGKIVYDRFIFDRLPFAQARAAATNG